MILQSRFGALVFCVLLGSISLSQTVCGQTIEVLGEFVAPLGLSQDGSIVYGRGPEDEALYWKDGKLTTLSQIAVALDATTDGSKIVGHQGEGDGRRARTWQNGGFTVLESPSGPVDFVLAMTTNGDGSIIGGQAQFDPPEQFVSNYGQALLWKNGVLSVQPTDKDYAAVLDLNDSGTIAVGYVSRSSSSLEREAAVWVDDKLFVIGPGGLASDKATEASLISADGSKIVINLKDPDTSPTENFQIYDFASGTTSAALPGFAMSVSGDGSIVVGYVLGEGLFMWKEGRGVRTLVKALTEDYQTVLTEEQLGSNRIFISDDGQWIAGSGKSEDKFVGYRLKLVPGGIVVNSNGDRGLDPDSAGCDTGELNDEGLPECTLRSAIEAVNLGRGDRIEFDIPETSSPTITISNALPAITVPVEIDGTTQSGGRVEIRGNELNAIGLDVQGGDSVIEGLNIHGFEGKDAAGIKLSQQGKNKVINNWIGVQVSGDGVSGNRVSVLIQDSPENQIGGSSEEERNIIHGLAQCIQILGAASNKNKIVGNYVGIGKSGAILEPQATQGVIIRGGDGNEVGGSGASGNVIAASVGILLSAENTTLKNTTITGNKIGLDLAGSTSSKGAAGIFLFADKSGPIDSLKILNNKVAGTNIGLLAGSIGDYLRDFEIIDNVFGLAFNDPDKLPSDLDDFAYSYGIRIDGVSNSILQRNIVAGYPRNLSMAGAVQFGVTPEVDENNDGVPESGGNLVLNEPGDGDDLDPTIPVAKGAVLDDNKIGINSSGEVPVGAEQEVGISIFSQPEKFEIKNNEVAGHSRYEIWLFNGKETKVNDNMIGTNDGKARGSKVGILIEDVEKGDIGPRNIISRNSEAGIVLQEGVYGTRIHGNFIGTNNGGGLAWANGIGIALREGESINDLFDNVIEDNTIARNQTAGVLFTESSVRAKILSNLIYLNGDGSGKPGINHEDPPFSAPTKILVVESNADSEGMFTVAFFTNSPEAFAEEGEPEPETIIEIFGNPGENETQGRTLLVSETIDPSKPFFKSFSVEADSVYRTSQNFTITLTRGGVTSQFSSPRTPLNFEVPTLQIEPSDSDEVVVSWEDPGEENLFTIEETRELTDGDSWTLTAEELEEVGDRTQVTLPILGESQFFRLTFNPNVLE